MLAGVCMINRRYLGAFVAEHRAVNQDQHIVARDGPSQVQILLLYMCLGYRMRKSDEKRRRTTQR